MWHRGRALPLLATAVFAACAGVLHPRPGVRTVAVDDNEIAWMQVPNGRRVRIDVYKPATRGRHPAAILLHGSGGIHATSSNTMGRYARTLAEQGIITFVVHYFDGTGDWTSDDSIEAAHYFLWVRDVRDAITWAKRRPDVRGNRFGLVGNSLGAWLAVGVAALDPRVSRVVLMGSGLEPFLPDSIKRMPPVLILHGDDDDVVPLSAAQHLEAFLQGRKYSVQMHVYPGEGHAYSDSTASDALTRAARFLYPRLAVQ